MREYPARVTYMRWYDVAWAAVAWYVKVTFAPEATFVAIQSVRARFIPPKLG